MSIRVCTSELCSGTGSKRDEGRVDDGHLDGMKIISNDVRVRASKIETKARRESGAAIRCGEGSAIHDHPLWAGAPRDSGASPRETGARAIS